MRRDAPRWTAAALALAVGLAAALALVAERGPAWAQPAALDEADDEADAVAFRHVGRDQGLPSAVVLSVVQDALGFVWVGTDEGLARYDGVDVREYRRTADSTSLSGNAVQALAAGPAGVVWAGTGAGLSRYDPATDRFQRVDGLPSDDVLAVAADSAGRAWVGTPDGLAAVGADGRVRSVDRPDAADPGGLPDPTVRALYLDGDAVWVGTDDGLARRAPDGRFRTFRPDSLGGALRVSAIAPSERGTLLLGTFDLGLVSFDPATGAFARLDVGEGLLARNVTSVHPDASGGVWVGTLGGGLRRLVPGEPARVYQAAPEDPASLSGDEVSALMEDRQGILWVGTYSGLDLFDRARGTAVRLRHDPGDPASLASNDVRSVLVADDGTLYVGTDETLDRSADGRAFRHVRIGVAGGRPDHAVRALHQSADGTVWVGTEGAGLRRVERDGSLAVVPLGGDGPGGHVVTAFADGGGALWVGTATRGLVRLDTETGEARALGRGDGLPSDRVLALAVDAGGAVWAGTDAGLCRLDGAVTCFRPDEGDPAALADGSVGALLAQDDGALWVGTRGGLHRLDTRDVGAGFTRYLPADTDLPGATVYAIVEDADGFLWLSTNGGLARLDPFVGTFSRRLGATGAERNLTAAAASAPDGRLLFGSTRGLLAFYPRAQTAQNANPPQVVITGVEVNGQPVEPGGEVLAVAAPVADRIELGPDQSYLTIGYAALHFSDPAENTYRYRLVGVLDEWREAGTTREATYNGLDPGRYSFEVQAANADGVGFEAGETASIAVVVHPPWWRTWWALTAFAAVALVALFRVDRWQRARLLRQERDRAERREAELRAETAEATQREALAEAAALKAENDRKAAEIERARDVQAANEKLEAANGQLEASLRDLRETQDQLVQSEKLASLGQLTAGIAHEIKNPLNFVNNFADLSVELAEELKAELGESPDRPVGEALADVGDLIDDLQENARRILEHGQRADRIVKSMLLHSRGGSSERGRVEINKFIDEYVNLAFHGARANDSDFQVEIVRAFGDDAGEVEVVPQEFGRVLINLLTNAFHAVHQRAEAEGDGYAPAVTVRTSRAGGEVAVEVEDNGTGIPPAVKARIFEPFFTTKPTGEGTGLGLSLAHDIVTQVHGGRMAVESVEGEGTTFRVVVPDRAA